MTHGAGAARTVGPAVAIVLVALCLRGPFAVVGPLVSDLEAELAIPATAVALLTSLPLVCFGLLSPVTPALARRVGLRRAVLVGMVVLGAGVLLRHAGVAGLFAGTVLVAGGIAVGNVLLPALVREQYGGRSAGVLGVAVAGIALSASIGAGLAAPLARATGSARTSLLLWIVPVVVAALAVAVLVRGRGTPAGAERRPRPVALRHDPVALAVTVYFGLQSLSFYAMLTWLPEVLRDDAAVSLTTSGALLALATAIGAPASLVMPRLAAARASQVGWVVFVAVATAGAIAGLLLAPTAAPVLWAVLYGIGTGAAFPLGMAIILLRTRDPGQTGRLSATAQTSGYLVAATGPFGIGVLHDLTGGWRTGLLVLLAVTIAQGVVGVAAGRPRFVAEPGAAAPVSRAAP